MDQIIMQINPRVNLKRFAAAEGSVASWINARGTSTGSELELGHDLQSSGGGGEKKAKMSRSCRLN